MIFNKKNSGKGSIFNLRSYFPTDQKSLLLAADKFLQNKALVSVIVVIIGFLLGTILIAIVGKSPSGMYSAIWQAITGYNSRAKNPARAFNFMSVSMTLNYLSIFILTGLSVGFAYKSGLFNIGAEGQYIVGMTTATVCAFFGPRIPIIHPLYCIVMAVLFSAAYGGIVGYLKAKYEVSEVVATIMLNYIALQASRLICSALPAGKQATYYTDVFPSSVSIEVPLFAKIFKYSKGSIDALDFGFIIAILAVIVYWFIVEKTSLGYELRATGFNRHAALASGIPVKRSIVLSMAIAGAFAGLAGALVALGSFPSGRIIRSMDNYGFQGIAVALIGNCQAVGIFLASYLLAVLKQAQALMQSRGVPKEIVSIIQGSIVVLVALRAVAVIIRNSISKKLAKMGGSK